jgi:16S rRNA (cytosine1402-N4)-methyltransferase
MKKKNQKYQNKVRIDYSEAVEYEYHLPALLEEILELMNIQEDGVYIDGTLGGGGHSAEILSRLGGNGKLYAFDKDLMALDHCKSRFAEELVKGEKSRIILLNECFSEACSIEYLREKADGILLDLGVSSRQLDDSRRGFSYRMESPLNLRFSPDGATAEDLLNTVEEREIERILRDYGEEPFAKNIARRIIQRRAAFPLRSTSDLRSIIQESVPGSQLFKALSRSFQAIRIAVNDELGVLEKILSNFMPILKKGGRIQIISYHSLEDRLVKNYFRELSQKKYSDDPLPVLIREPQVKLIGAKPIIPSDREIKLNPRVRSAKLRVAEKI